jgi:hypothetical protein
VGGSTTVNWTSSFRTPPATLASYWQEHFGLTTTPSEALAPYFQQAERGSTSAPGSPRPTKTTTCCAVARPSWAFRHRRHPRNVKGCWNLGSCGMGCPTNAKQSMLVTTIPGRAGQGRHAAGGDARREVRSCRARRRPCNAWRCSRTAPWILATPLQPRITAKHYVLAGGAINSPAVLMRSARTRPAWLAGQAHLPAPGGDVGRVMPGKGRGLARRAADHLHRPLPGDPAHRRPHGLQAGGAAAAPGDLRVHCARAMGRAGRAAAPVSPTPMCCWRCCATAFHDEAAGGSVKLRSDGSPVAGLPADRLCDGRRPPRIAEHGRNPVCRRCKAGLPVHELARPTPAGRRRGGHAGLPMKPLLTKVVSAHVMGGCGMAG